MSSINARVSKLLLFCAALVFTVTFFTYTAFAVPASPDPFYHTRPDGTTITLYNRGDEWLSWTEDADGYLVTYDEGEYYYAIWTDEGPEATNMLVGETGYAMNVTPAGMQTRSGATVKEISQGSDVPETVLEKANAMQAKYGDHSSNITNASTVTPFAASAHSEAGGRTRANDGLGNRKLLVIYITWPDRTGLENLVPLSEEEIADKFFGQENSVNNYYKEVFGYDDEDVIVPAFADKPVWTVELDGREWSDPERWKALPGWDPVDDDFVWVPHTDKHWNPLEWRGVDDDKYYVLLWMMFASLYDAQDKQGLDLTQFKNHEGDTMLYTSELSITFVVDGYEGAYSSNGATSNPTEKPGYWASSLTFGGPNLEFGTSDDPNERVSVWSFFGQSSHLDDEIPFVIGTAAHELGHSSFGYKDLYDYATKAGLLGLINHTGVGYWSLMDQGSWSSAAKDDGTFELRGTSPCYVDAYNLVLGNCVDPVILNYNDAGDYEAVSHLDLYAVVPTGQPKNLSGQYFLLQQRSNVGYDRATFSNVHPVGKKDDDAGGLLIFHVDENVKPANGRINDKNTHMRAKVEEAHGGTQHLSTQYFMGIGPNRGDMFDLFGNGVSKINMFTDPSSGLYGPYTDNTTAPVSNIESGVIITGIKWNGSISTTSFSIPNMSAVYGIESIELTPSSLKANVNLASNRKIKVNVNGFNVNGTSVKLFMSDGISEPVEIGTRTIQNNTATFTDISIPLFTKYSEEAKKDTPYYFSVEWDGDGDNIYVPLPELTETFIAYGEPTINDIVLETSEYPYTGAVEPNKITVTGRNLNYGIRFIPVFSDGFTSSAMNRLLYDFSYVANKEEVSSTIPVTAFFENETIEPREVYFWIGRMGTAQYLLGSFASVMDTFIFEGINSNTVTVAGRPGITEVIPEVTAIGNAGGEALITLKGVNNLLTDGVAVTVTVTDGFDYNETFEAEVISDTEAVATVIFPESAGLKAEYTVSADIAVPYNSGEKIFTNEAAATIKVGVVESITADNGSLEIIFNEMFTEDLELSDFTVTYSINGGGETILDITNFSFDNLVCILGFDPLPSEGYEQNIIFTVTFGNTTLVSNTVTIDKCAMLDEIEIVYLTPSMVTVTKGKTIQLSFETDPYVDITKYPYSMTWKSLTPTIVAVTQSGLVTGKTIGMGLVQAVITDPYGAEIVITFSIQVK